MGYCLELQKDFFSINSYLNTTFIKKQKFSDADLNYGGFAVEFNDQMLEIGEVRSLCRSPGVSGKRENCCQLCFGFVDKI